MISGVDRSHLNGKIALSSLVEKGISFIWFKASQGATYQDPTFNAAWQEVKAIPNMIRGAYHFFDPRVDGIVQANNFLSLKINFSGVGCLPPCVDVEDLVGSDASDTTALNQWVSDNWKLALQRLNNFLAHMKGATGHDCIIYTYNGYMREYFRSTPFPNNPFWLSSILTAKNPHCPVRYDNGHSPLFWQYTYGLEETDMDGDTFIGTDGSLKVLANIVT